MSIQRSNFDHVFRIDKIAKDRDEEKEGKKEKKKVFYNGRSWKETEENLPVQPKENKKEIKKYKSETSPLYVDQFLFEKAKARFAQLTTLEEKCAQLCFYQTQAFYDESEFNELKNIILNEELGGIIFSDGTLDRQIFLIEQLQSLAKTPLLFGNSFTLGYKTISESLAGQSMPEKQALGSHWMRIIKHFGMHIQMDYSPYLDYEPCFNDDERKIIRNGMREVRGIVGKAMSMEGLAPQPIQTHTLSPGFALSSSKKDLINEVPGLKTLEFTYFNNMFSSSNSFSTLRDAFLFSRKEDIKKIILKLVDLVKQGKISEEELDKKVLRILLFKSLLEI